MRNLDQNYEISAMRWILGVSAVIMLVLMSGLAVGFFVSCVHIGIDRGWTVMRSAMTILSSVPIIAFAWIAYSIWQDEKKASSKVT